MRDNNKNVCFVKMLGYTSNHQFTNNCSHTKLDDSLCLIYLSSP
jgi:hypothetical protein